LRAISIARVSSFCSYLVRRRAPQEQLPMPAVQLRFEPSLTRAANLSKLIDEHLKNGGRLPGSL
jgi:hypothetical protein